MHNYRGTSWKRKTTHPLPYTGFVIPFASAHSLHTEESASPVHDRTVHHGFRIALRRPSLVTNDPLDTCTGAGEAMSLPSLTTGIRLHHHAE